MENPNEFNQDIQARALTDNSKDNNEKPQIEQSSFNYKYFTNPQRRLFFARSVDDLVQRVVSEQVSNLVFMDKSARPIITVFEDLWQREHPNLPLPKINFLNIGTTVFKKYAQKIGLDNGDQDGSWDDQDRGEIADKIDSGEIKITEILGEEAVQEIKEKYAYLAEAASGSKVIIVDESKGVGATEVLTKKLLEYLFPGLEISFVNIESDPAISFKRRIPWAGRFSEKKAGYGVVGVVDPKEGSVVSQATHSTSLSKRQEYMDDKEAVALKRIQEASEVRKQRAGQLVDLLQKLLDRYVETDNPLLVAIAQTHFDEIDWERIKQMRQKILDASMANFRFNSPEEGNKFHSEFIDFANNPLRLSTYLSKKEYGEAEQAGVSNKELLNFFEDLFPADKIKGLAYSMEYGGSNGEDYRMVHDSQEEKPLLPEFYDDAGRYDQKIIAGLRDEMHAIAEEYWRTKETEKA